MLLAEEGRVTVAPPQGRWLPRPTAGGVRP